MDLTGGMTPEDSKQMLTDAEMQLNPDVARLMDDRRNTLYTRNLMDVWKHDKSSFSSEHGLQQERPAAELRSLLMKKMCLHQESPMDYKPPTPPHKKRVRIKTGHVLLNKRQSPDTRPVRQVHSAPVTARNTDRLPNVITYNQSPLPSKPRVHNGFLHAPATSVQVHISTPYAQRRPYSSDSQFSALKRSISPKPRPHLYDEYAHYLNEKPLKTSANLKSWKKQVSKQVEIQRKKYSIPVERKVPPGPEYEEEEYSESNDQSSYGSRTPDCNMGNYNGYDALYSESFRPATMTPNNRQGRYGSGMSNHMVQKHCYPGDIRRSLSTRSGDLSRQSIYSQGSSNSYRSHLQHWNA